MTVPLPILMFEDSELLDDDGVSDRGCCCAVDIESCEHDAGRGGSLDEERDELLVLCGNLYAGART